MPDRTEPEEPWIMPCIECGLQPDECRCPTPQWAKCGPTYDELLASHKRLLVALEEMDAFCETGIEEFRKVIHYTDWPYMERIREAITAAKSLQGGK